MAKFVFWMSLISLLTWVGIRIERNEDFKRNVVVYLQEAAKADNAAEATSNLKIALAELKNRGLESGNTSLFGPSTEDDLGRWYQRLETSLNDLEYAARNASHEAPNTQAALAEMRHTLAHEDVTVFSPSGISIYPHNVGFAWWGWLSLIIIPIAGIMWAISSNEESEPEPEPNRSGCRYGGGI